MAKGGLEYRFRIEAYTPETLPMGRLAEYLHELAVILGERSAVHLVRLEPGSTVVVPSVDAEAIPKVNLRAQAVDRHQAPPDAMRAYQNINLMLRADNGEGVLEEPSGGVIIRFPGVKEGPRFGSVTQQSSVDGEVIRVGGTGERVRVMLRSEDELIAACYADRVTAKKLAAHLFEPVRLVGTGRFIRGDDGAWRLEYFAIDSFKPLADEPLSSVVMALRAIPGGEWGEDALEQLEIIRRGPPGVQDGGV